jgi:HlyD family secretion protein
MSERRPLSIRLIGVLVALIGGGAWWWILHRHRDIYWQGYAEADFVKVSPTLLGQLVRVSVSRGSRVEAGAPLFDQDDVADAATRDQTERQLATAQEQLTNLEAPARDTEIRQAEASIADAKAVRAQVAANLKRAEGLRRMGFISAKAWEQAHSDFLSADSKLQKLEAALAQLRAPIGRESEIKSQKAAVEAARAALASAEWRLKQRHVSSPVSGIVADVLAAPGETLSAGSVAVSLLPRENVFVRFFVPEEALPNLRRGARVGISCDRCAAGLEGAISFISSQAEYTPPFIYSEDSRAKLVYLVEARSDPGSLTDLNPGQPVTVKPIEGPHELSRN